MGRRIPKRYGKSGNATCPFCGAMAIAKNEEGLSVCIAHKKSKQKFEDIKCDCGSWLEIKDGKFGMYFNCLNCGNINYEKGMAMKDKQDAKKPLEVKKKQRQWPARKKVTERRSSYSGKQEIVISSRDSQWFD